MKRVDSPFHPPPSTLSSVSLPLNQPRCWAYYKRENIPILVVVVRCCCCWNIHPRNSRLSPITGGLRKVVPVIVIIRRGAAAANRRILLHMCRRNIVLVAVRMELFHSLCSSGWQNKFLSGYTIHRSWRRTKYYANRTAIFRYNVSTEQPLLNLLTR